MEKSRQTSPVCPSCKSLSVGLQADTNPDSDLQPQMFDNEQLPSSSGLKQLFAGGQTPSPCSLTPYEKKMALTQALTLTPVHLRRLHTWVGFKNPRSEETALERQFRFLTDASLRQKSSKCRKLIEKSRTVTEAETRLLQSHHRCVTRGVAEISKI